MIFAWLYREWGGAEIQLVEIARRAPSGWNVTVVAPSATDRSLREMWDGIADRWVDVGHLDMAPPRSVRHRVARRLNDARVGDGFVRALADLPAGVPVHVDVPPWSLPVTLWRIAHRRPVLLTWHTPLEPPTATLRRLRLALALRFVGRRRNVHVSAASAAARRDAARWFRLPESSIDVLRAGFDPDEIDEIVVDPDEPEPTSAPETDHVLVGVGALVERKGVDVALRAVAALRENGYRVRLVWIGDGIARAELEALRRELGLDAVVDLRRPTRGKANRTELLGAVARADVYVQPSRVDGLPIATIEAMALGRPVVATDVGAVTELEDGVTVVRPDDPHALTAAVAALLDDPAARRSAGSSARTFVRQHFDMDAVAPRAFECYERLADAP